VPPELPAPAILVGRVLLCPGVVQLARELVRGIAAVDHLELRAQRLRLRPCALGIPSRLLGLPRGPLRALARRPLLADQLLPVLLSGGQALPELVGLTADHLDLTARLDDEVRRLVLLEPEDALLGGGDLVPELRGELPRPDAKARKLPLAADDQCFDPSLKRGAGGDRLRQLGDVAEVGGAGGAAVGPAREEIAVAREGASRVHGWDGLVRGGPELVRERHLVVGRRLLGRPALLDRRVLRCLHFGRVVRRQLGQPRRAVGIDRRRRLDGRVLVGIDKRELGLPELGLQREQADDDAVVDGQVIAGVHDVLGRDVRVRQQAARAREELDERAVPPQLDDDALDVHLRRVRLRKPRPRIRRERAQRHGEGAASGRPGAAHADPDTLSRLHGLACVIDRPLCQVRVGGERELAAREHDPPRPCRAHG